MRYFLPDFFLEGVKYQPQFAPRIRHELILPRLFDLKRANLGFHHACGLFSASAATVNIDKSMPKIPLYFFFAKDNCELGVFLRQPDFDSAYQSIHAVADANLFNSAPFLPAAAPPTWNYESIRVPTMHSPNSK